MDDRPASTPSTSAAHRAGRIARAGLALALAVGLTGCLTTRAIAYKVVDREVVFKVGLYTAPWVDTGSIVAIGLSDKGFASWGGDARPVAILLGLDAAAALVLWLVYRSVQGASQLGG